MQTPPPIKRGNAPGAPKKTKAPRRLLLEIPKRFRIPDEDVISDLEI